MFLPIPLFENVYLKSCLSVADLNIRIDTQMHDLIIFIGAL